MKRIPDGFTRIEDASWLPESTRRFLVENHIVTVEEMLALQAIPEVQPVLEASAGPIPNHAQAVSLTSSPLLAPVPEAVVQDFRFAAKKPPEREKLEKEQPVQGKEAFFLAPMETKSVNLIPGMFAVKSQGNRGTCVAFGTTAMVEFLEGRKHLLSEQFLYWGAKMLDGHKDEEGTWIRYAMMALEEYGICTAKAWPYNPHTGSTVHQGPPPDAARAEARNHRVLRSIKLNPTSVNDLRRVLAGGDEMGPRVISFAIPVYNSWLRNPITYKTGRIGMPLPGEECAGGHCMTLVGFEDDPEWPGGGYFIFRNSWGTQWAAENPLGAGYGVLPYEFMARHGWEAWTAEVREKSTIKQVVTNDIVLGRTAGKQREYGDKGLMFLGNRNTGYDQEGTSRVLVDMMFPHIIFISGKRGSGKSYTLGVLAEELARSNLDIGVILVDPVGVFWSLKYPNKDPAQVEALQKLGLQPQGMKNVNVLAPVGVYRRHRSQIMDGEFSLKVSDLSADDWCMVFGINRFGPQGLLIEKVIKEVVTGYRAMRDQREVDVPPVEAFNLGNMIQCINDSMEIGSSDNGFARETRRSVGARLRGAAGWGVFSREGTPLSSIIRPGFLTVLDLSHPAFDDTLKALMVGILARKILSARILQTSYHDSALTGPDAGDGKQSLPVTWLMVDEAHLLVPRHHTTPASAAIIDYAKLGRKPGCAMVLATQRPSATNDEVLSQVDVMVGHTLALEDDIRALFKRMPAKVAKSMHTVNFIRDLPTGTALVGDQQAGREALTVRVRPRLSHHAGGEAKPNG